MRSLRYMGVIAISYVLAWNVATASPAEPAEPKSLDERIDLTRITVLQADYARAARERNEGDLAKYDRELVAMLQDDVLRYAPGAGEPAGAERGGTGGGTARPRGDAPAVAVDEDEVGAAALDSKVVDLSRQFISLAGRTDDASLATKASVIGSLQSISQRAHFPHLTKDTAKEREARERVRQEQQQRERVERAPVNR